MKFEGNNTREPNLGELAAYLKGRKGLALSENSIRPFLEMVTNAREREWDAGGVPMLGVPHELLVIFELEVALRVPESRGE